MKTTCIMCPMGCQIEVEEIKNEIKVKGNSCVRGELYGKDEYLHPKRSITTLLKTKSGQVVSCKTSKPIPKELIFNLLDYLKNIVVDDNLDIGTVVVKNIINTGVDIVITSKK